VKRTLIIFTLTALAAISLSLVKYSWESWSPDGCRSLNCYCEPLRDSLVLQPITTYSNLSFLLVGLLILGQSRVRSNGFSHSPQAKVFGFAALFIGAGSFFYHASLTRAGEWSDLMGTYLFISFIMLYNLARLRPLGGLTFAISYIALNSALGVQMIVARELQQIVFGILAAGALAFEVLVQFRRRPYVQFRFLIGGLACFAVGAFIWIFDGGLLPCSPNAPLTWHAVWHTLMAATAGLLYLYYRSEQERPERNGA